jgi:hypothetical protein
MHQDRCKTRATTPEGPPRSCILQGWYVQQLIIALVLNVSCIPVKKTFRKNWRHRSAGLPKIARMFLVTWTAKQRKGFDNYRSAVVSSSCHSTFLISVLYLSNRDAIARKRKPKVKECKKFRSERRACHLGDPGRSTKLCRRASCALCRALRSGFATSLRNKQMSVMMGAQ